MMSFKFVLIFVFISIQNSNSFAAETPGDCKDLECLFKLFLEQKKIPTLKTSGKIK